jgi:hypothetical protein
MDREIQIRIQAMSQKLNPLEILNNIPEKKLQEIKGKGVLQAYLIAKEGTSQPKVLEENRNRQLVWPKKIIQSIGAKIKNGLKFFVNHNNDNSTNNRKTVGEIVGTYVKNIGDKLAQIVIGHFDDESSVKNMDINSMEANVKYNDDTGEVTDVNGITGIALGSSNENSPAFPGAVRLATLQCFDEKEKINEPGKGEKTMATFEEVKEFVRSHNVWPSQLYNEETLKQDRSFSHIFDEKEKAEKRVTELDNEFKSYKETNDKIIKDGQKALAKNKLAELLPKTLTEKQSEFVKTRFNPDSIEDLSEAGLKTYLDNSLEEYKTFAKLFNGKKEDENINDELNNDDNTDEKEDIIQEALDSVLGKGE